MAAGKLQNITSLTKQIKELQNEIKAIRATAELPEGFSQYNCFILEKPEDRERCERLEQWIADHPEYDEKIYILKISRIDGSDNPITQEKSK